ncbi:MAG: hypothetical protein NVSMB14_03680 [Isosphaeraceae bacterium]
MFGKRHDDGPRHPLALGVLGRFLAASEECLIGRLDESGVVLEANAGLLHWLGAKPSPRLTDALLASSGERWEEVLTLLDAPGRNMAVRLDFGRGSPASASFRCLASRDDQGLWLFGERLFETIEPLMREVLAIQGDIARLNRGLRKRAADLERRRAAVEALSRTDALTGIANRREADDRLLDLVGQAGSGAPRPSCLMIDLDHFKTINDTYGHAVGDNVLRESASTFAACLRSTDLVARIGGEEFLVILPATQLVEASALADRLRIELNAHVIPTLGRGISGSFGVARLRPNESAAELVERADAALLRAKRFGRDRIEIDFDPPESTESSACAEPADTVP